MILPNKDVMFEKSLLKYSVDVLNYISDSINIDVLYSKMINIIHAKDMDAILVFLSAIGQIDIRDKMVIKIVSIL